MAKKYKLTGFARFFLFLIIFVPAVFFGVTYLKNENPSEVIKNAIPEKILNKDSGSSSVTEDAILEGKIKTLEQTNEALRDEIKSLKEEIRKLKGSN